MENAGIITVQDTRENLMNMQQFRNNQVQQVINPEQIIDDVANGLSFVVNVAGTVLNVATKIIPGKLDDIAVAVAQPAVIGAIEAGRNFFKGVFVNKDAEQISSSFADLAGNVMDISIRDTNLVETLQVRKQARQDLENDRGGVRL